MDSSIHSIARYAGRHRTVRVDVRITAGLPSITVAGATIGAIRTLADRVRATTETAGVAWPFATLKVNVSPWGPPESLEDIELAIVVAVVIASQPAPPRSGRQREVAAWGALPGNGTGRVSRGQPAIVSIMAPTGSRDGQAVMVRPVHRLSDVRPILLMTNGPPRATAPRAKIGRGGLLVGDRPRRSPRGR